MLQKPHVEACNLRCRFRLHVLTTQPQQTVNVSVACMWVPFDVDAHLLFVQET